jgi:hypothetical protein
VNQTVLLKLFEVSLLPPDDDGIVLENGQPQVHSISMLFDYIGKCYYELKKLSLNKVQITVSIQTKQANWS